jgi:hypothetical protein
MKSPDVIYLYIPLMKELHMSWSEIKSLPRKEIEGLLFGLSQYNKMHQFDGYDEKDVSEMAKNKPAIRSDYYRYMELKRSYEERMGAEVKAKSLAGLIH